MRRVPIRARVALWSAVIMAVVLISASWLVYHRVGTELAEAADGELWLRSDDMVTDIQDANGGPSADLRRDFNVPRDQYAQLIALDGTVVEASPLMPRASILGREELARAARDTFLAHRSAVPGLEEPSRYLARPVTGGSTRYVLVTGSSQHHRVETLASLRRQFLVGVPVVLVMATIAGYFLAGLSLRPVESMRRRAASISAETAGERLPIAPTRDELERLGETLNAMLERLDTALQREREFVADAGHELRTPLTLLRTELELALRHGTSAEDLREAVRRSAEEVERLAQLADGLLLIARADRGTLDLRLEEIDASELLTSVGSRFDWRVEEAGRQFSAGADSALRIPGDRLRLEQALSNMVDNALRHGRGAVHLTAARADGFVELHVTDEGDGFPPEFVGQAFERFARADQARTRGGSGLGLAIVRTIAEAHGGSAHAANAERGGADVWVSVPSGAYRR